MMLHPSRFVGASGVYPGAGTRALAREIHERLLEARVTDGERAPRRALTLVPSSARRRQFYENSAIVVAQELDREALNYPASLAG